MNCKSGPTFSANTYLGQVELSSLRAAPRGQVTIQVRFEVDESGSLRIHATDVSTGRDAHATLQLVGISGVPAADRETRPWGFGWRLNWPAHSANFGDLLGPRAYGHWGATGTLCWIDPDTESFFILFTTQPQEPEGRFLARLSNVISAAIR